MNNIPFIILAGGLATRLKPITNTIPKALVSVAGKPFIYHQLELLHNNNINHIILCVGHLGELIETEIGNTYKNIKIEYSYDGPVLLGTGGAVKKAISKVGDIFGVLYGDSYLPINYNDVIKHYNECNTQGLMTVYLNNNNYDTSNIILNEGKISKYSKIDLVPEMKHIDYGFSIFNKSVFELFPDSFDLSKIIIQLVENNQLAGYEVYNRFYEIGSFSGLSELELYLQSR
jgi:hypothetical protein